MTLEQQDQKSSLMKEESAGVLNENVISQQEKDTPKTQSCDEDEFGLEEIIPGSRGDDESESESETATSAVTMPTSPPLSASPSSTITDLLYDAKVPITHFGLLIMLKPLNKDNLLVFNGYAKLPNGQPGPAEIQKIFKNKGDVVIAVNDCQIQGRKSPAVINLIRQYVSQKDRKNEESLAITFKMMDASLMTSQPTNADSVYIAESQSFKLSKLKTQLAQASLTTPPIELTGLKDGFQNILREMEQYAKEREFDHTNKNELQKKTFGVFHF
uniref:PDZ domain-containing protein n=1 Tax=Asterionellopsis glacialis TaxID=33640 RepID=A0A7S0KXN1_9STRA|mmetsp:Transcript_2114/g.3072  ORF Transcript_2114/g.3072 Transcript_2114/m.3072 type:complete len:272 (+) Transcript_2114:3-818(+)